MAKDGKKFLIIGGGGKQAAAIAHYLLEHAGAETVGFFDSSAIALSAVHERWDCYGNRVRAHLGDASNLQAMTHLMRGYDAVIGSASYKLNENLTRAAIAAGTHFCDLGGNNDVVAKQFAMSESARAGGVRIVPDCGVAPGMASILAQDGIDSFGGAEHVKSVSIYCGGLPQNPIPPLKYALFFAVSGLINEYKERCEVLRGGKRVRVRSLTEIETVDIDGIGPLEAAHTSGGASTLIDTYDGKIDDICYKTLRYPADPGELSHWQIMNALRDFGMFEDRWAEPPNGFENVMPRPYLEAKLEKDLPHNVPDVLVMRVSVQGKDGRAITYDIADRMDEATGLTGMQRTTGYSAAIVAEMLANGEIAECGTLRQEQHVPTLLFLKRLRACGIETSFTESERRG